MGNIIRGNSGEIFELNVRDFSGAKIDGFRSNAEDEENNTALLKIFMKKYGIKINIEGLKTKEGETKKEADWLSTDSEFLKF